MQKTLSLRLSQLVRLWSVILALGLATPALAQTQQKEALSPDRPDQTNSPITVAPGVFQLETGWVYSFEQSRDGTELSQSGQHTFPQTMLRIGLLDPLELRLEYGGYNLLFQTVTPDGQPAQNSFSAASGDFALGLKYRVYKSDVWWIPDTGLEARASVVTGPLPHPPQSLDPSLKLLLEHNFSDKISLGYNLGLGSVSEKEASGRLLYDSRNLQVRTHSFLYTASLSVMLHERVDSFLEVYGDVPLNGSSSNHTLNAGAFYAFSPDFKLDAAAGVSFYPWGNWFLGLGASYRFN